MMRVRLRQTEIDIMEDLIRSEIEAMKGCGGVFAELIPMPDGLYVEVHDRILACRHLSAYEAAALREGRANWGPTAWYCWWVRRAARKLRERLGG